MKRITNIILAALLIAAIGGGGYFLYQSRAATNADTADTGTYSQVVTVTQGDLNSTLSVVGQLAAEQSASLAFDHMSGTTELISLTVQGSVLPLVAGNTVTAGQVLATIDAAPYQQALDQAKSDLQAAEEALADLKAPATALKIAQADMVLAQAQQTLEQAKADLADLTDPDLTDLRSAVQDAQDNIALLEIKDDLAQRDSLAKSERDLQYSVNWYQRRIAQLEALSVPTVEQSAELAKDQEALTEAGADLARVQIERELARQAGAAELAQAKVRLADAQETLVDAQTGGDAVALAQAQLAVTQAQVALQVAQEARLALDEGAEATKLAAAQAAVDKKRLAVSEAEAALTGTELVAPFDGTILETYASVGERVTANTTILSVANLKTLRVVASVDETTIRQVSAGQSAAIIFDAFPGQSFTGEVLSVPLQGALQGGVMVYSVPVSLTGAEELSLLVGMTANVEIQVAQATDALLVPTIALQQSNGLFQVLVPNTTDPEGDPEAAPVEVGVSDGTYTTIVKGLNAGDQVIVRLTASDSSSASRNMGGGILMNLSRQFGG